MAPVSGALVGASSRGLAILQLRSAACFDVSKSTTSIACPVFDPCRIIQKGREEVFEGSTKNSSKPRWLREGCIARKDILPKDRGSLHVVRSSGRFSASVIRGISGKQRRRRPKKGADGSEEDESNDDEPYSSFEDAPIFGSLHGDSFDVDEEKDDAPALVQTINSQNRVLFGSSYSGEGSESNGVLEKKESAPTEKGKQEPALEAQDQLIKSEKKKAERSKQGLASGTSKKGRKKRKKSEDAAQLMSGGSGVKDKSIKKAARKLKRSEAFNGRAEKMVDSGSQNGAPSSDAMTQLQGTEHNGFRSGAEESPVVNTGGSQNGAQTCSAGDSRLQNGALSSNAVTQLEGTERHESKDFRTGAGKTPVLITGGSQNGAQIRNEGDSRSQNGALSSDTTNELRGTEDSGSKGLKSGAEEAEVLASRKSQNGAQSSSAEAEVQSPEKERLEERLTSSLQAGPSNSEELTSLRDAMHSLHLSLSAGSGRPLFIISTAAVENMEALAQQEVSEEQEASENGILTGAAILEAASSLVETLTHPAQVMQAGEEVSEQIASAVGDVKDAVVESVSAAVEAVGSGVEEATGVVTDTVSQLGEQVMETVAETVDAASDTVSNLVEAVTDSVASSVAETVDTVAESLSDVGDAVVRVITEEEELGDTEFETFSSHLNGPEFRGRRGLDNYRVMHDGESSFHLLYDAYNFSLKLPPHQFALVVLVLPLLMSVMFTGIYLLDMQGLVPEESVQTVLVELQKGGHVWGARAYGLFQVFMFSLSLATGLQPVLAPVTPFSFVAANMNALLAQLLFVFLSGSVFARLSQRSRPIRCSSVALICPPCHTNRVGKEWTNRVLMARYVLAGPKPSELVDVKVDLTFTYNTITRSGSYFMRQVSLKLVKSEVAHQVGGMLVRHVIDESSPLYRRSEEMLRKEDAVFKLSVVGLERSSMQSVFELQHYCVADGDVIWDAEFEDTVYVNKSLQRVIDHSKLSRWKAVSAIGLSTVKA